MNRIKILKDEIKEKDKNIIDLEENIKKKFKKARDVHQRMLPKKLPDTGDIIISTYYRPAEYIGGDYYNVMEIDHESMSPFFDQYLVYYFDVSGHGIDSTLLSIFINDTIESFLKLRHNPGEMISPKELMNYIDNAYQEEGFPDDYLVCIFLGLLDLNKNRLNYCSTGFQYPIFKIDAGKKVEKIKTGGLPVSSALAFVDKTLEEKEMIIDKNSMILLTTDGLLEQEINGKSYFEEIDKILNSYSSYPAPLMKDIIYADFYNFSAESMIKDDLTFLILNRMENKRKEWNSARSDLSNRTILEEVLNFMEESCENQKNSSFDKLKNIVKSILLKENNFTVLQTINIKAYNNPEYLIFSFEDKKNNLNWKQAAGNSFDEFIKIKNEFVRNDFEFRNNKVYISYNNFYNKIYFFIPKLKSN
ncbi:MAG: PP2C family protein-serine/threonine phosphatase [Bacillota bacterium]